MSDRLVRIAAASVRGWTRLYTSRMAPAVRDARRAEIESDLWEFQADTLRRRDAPRSAAAHMLARLLVGIPDDLLWRFEHAVNRGWPVRRSVVVAIALVVFAVAFWTISVMRASPLPQPPPSPLRFDAHPRTPPPPPPPPPPPRVDWWEARRLRRPEPQR